jgi:hypothetical protein
VGCESYFKPNGWGRLGCLVVLDIRDEGRGMIALVFGKVGDDYRIVHVDDN